MKQSIAEQIAQTYTEIMQDGGRSGSAWAAAVEQAERLHGKLVSSSNDDCDYRNRSDYPTEVYQFLDGSRIKIMYGGAVVLGE